MNKLVKRGFNVWLIFIKNRIASSIMMLMSGVMMFIGALQGKGNDTMTLPLAIAQSVERRHGKDEVTSSNLVRGSIFVVEKLLFLAFFFSIYLSSKV